MAASALLPAGLAYDTSTRVSSSITSFAQKMLPVWLPHTTLLGSHPPTTYAVTLWLLLAGWKTARQHQEGVSDVVREAHQAIYLAQSAFEKADGNLREVKGLEMQFMQLASIEVEHQNETSRATFLAAEEAKTEIEEVVEKLRLRVKKVRKIIEKAMVVAQDGDVSFAGDMVVNAGKLAERVAKEEEKVGEKLQEVREMLVQLGLDEAFF